MCFAIFFVALFQSFITSFLETIAYSRKGIAQDRHVFIGSIRFYKHLLIFLIQICFSKSLSFQLKYYHYLDDRYPKNILIQLDTSEALSLFWTIVLPSAGIIGMIFGGCSSVFPSKVYEYTAPVGRSSYRSCDAD